MNATTRRREIAELLALEGEASFAALAERYATSVMTIRRDIEYLEREGLARHARGGAIFVHRRAFELPVHQRASDQAAAKAAIGGAAARLLSPGETIILDIGTTTAAMAAALDKDLGVTVVTNSLLIANELAAYPHVTTIVTGGTLRPGELALVGPRAQGSFAHYNCDTLFLGVAAVAAVGVTEFNEDDALVKRAAIDAARRVVVLADATKLGRVTFANVAPLAEVDVLITDASPDHDVLIAARAEGVEVLCVQSIKESA